MKDDLGTQLDEFYRRLDPAGGRVEAAWRSRVPAARRAGGRGTGGRSWFVPALAAAACLLLVVLALRSNPPAPGRPLASRPLLPTPESAHPESAPIVSPVTRPAPAEAVRAPEPVRPAPVPLEPPAPPETPSAPLPPLPASTPPGLRREETMPVRALPAPWVVKEAEGSFEVGSRSVRGKLKDLRIAAGDRLRSSGVVRLSLAEDRSVFLASRTIVEVRPGPDRLTFWLEQGEILADLVGRGPPVQVATRACEVNPLGTVFDVRMEGGRALVLVEKGRVEVRSPRGRATLRAAESIQASEDGDLGRPGPADFRTLGWARSHRAPEITLFAEDFSKPGAWEGQIEKGLARAMPAPGGPGQLLHLAADAPLFEVPVRGSITIMSRTDRAGKLKIQFFCPELRTTYVRQDIPVLRSPGWRTVTADFDEFVPSDKTRPARLPAGATVTDLVLFYSSGDEDRGSFWVGALRVTESRP